MLSPICFSIPEEKIITDEDEKEIVKSKIISDLIPGVIKTYIYNSEKEYYNEYRTSYFATTQKKGGWDCLRHYEILGNGCIPYFRDIERCPKNTLYLLPKELIIEGNKLYNLFKNKKIEELCENEINEYKKLQKRMLEYTRNHLSTIKMASYIINKIKNKKISKILYLSGEVRPDYLRCLTLHGFKKLYGKECHDYPKIEHIYKSKNIEYNKLYGKGMTYTNLLEQEYRDDKIDQNIEDYIKKKYFDIIIYGSYHRGMPYYEMINKIYSPDEIILLCGDDIHKCNYKIYVNKGHNVFVREL